jgi:hypothetical protein
MPVARSRVSQGAEAEEVDALLGQLELDRRAGRAPAAPSALGGIVEGHALGRLQIALADQALDRLLQELLEGVGVVHELLQVLVGEHAAAHEGLEDRVVEGLQAVLVPLPLLVAEAALEQEVGQLADELLEVQVLPELPDVPVVPRDRHGG